MTACCPMCSSAIAVSDLDALIRDRSITGHAEAILRALWAAGGQSLGSGSMFDAIYADDSDGGPNSNGAMFSELRHGLADLHAALAGSGVAIRSVHPRKVVYRLVITGM